MLDDTTATHHHTHTGRTHTKCQPGKQKKKKARCFSRKPRVDRPARKRPVYGPWKEPIHEENPGFVEAVTETVAETVTETVVETAVETVVETVAGEISQCRNTVEGPIWSEQGRDGLLQSQQTLEEPLAQAEKIVDIFSTASVMNRINRITTCWCSGVRVHSSCAGKFDIDLPHGTRLCLFDGGVHGVCTSDCISCVPCIVCHKTKDTDTHASLMHDFPVGDNWLFREERVCPSCTAQLLPDHGRHCDVCNFDYDTTVY